MVDGYGEVATYGDNTYKGEPEEASQITQALLLLSEQYQKDYTNG